MVQDPMLYQGLRTKRESFIGGLPPSTHLLHSQALGARLSIGFQELVGEVSSELHHLLACVKISLPATIGPGSSPRVPDHGIQRWFSSFMSFTVACQKLPSNQTPGRPME